MAGAACALLSSVITGQLDDVHVSLDGNLAFAEAIPGQMAAAESALAAEFAGKEVKVTGVLEGNTLKITSIEAVAVED